MVSVNTLRMAALIAIYGLLVACASKQNTQVVASNPSAPEQAIRAPSNAPDDMQTLQPLPPAAKSMLSSARTFMSKGDLVSASRQVERAQRIAPASGQVYELWGDILVREGRAERARQMYQRAQSLYPADSTRAALLSEKLSDSH